MHEYFLDEESIALKSWCKQSFPVFYEAQWLASAIGIVQKT